MLPVRQPWRKPIQDQWRERRRICQKPSENLPDFVRGQHSGGPTLSVLILCENRRSAQANAGPLWFIKAGFPDEGEHVYLPNRIGGDCSITCPQESLLPKDHSTWHEKLIARACLADVPQTAGADVYRENQGIAIGNDPRYNSASSVALLRKGETA